MIEIEVFFLKIGDPPTIRDLRVVTTVFYSDLSFKTKMKIMAMADLPVLKGQFAGIKENF